VRLVGDLRVVTTRPLLARACSRAHARHFRRIHPVNERSACQVVDSLEAARAASRLAWREAHSIFSAVGDAELGPEDLEIFGEAAWWTGKLDQAIRVRERAYASYTAAGDMRSAARMALTLSWDYEGRGSFAVSNGWFATAERLLADLPESPEHGRALLVHALTALFAEGDLERAEALFDEAYALAQRVGDRDVQVLSLSGRGRAYIKSGQIDKGLALLDEATASAISGDLKPHSTGIVYC
jgi:tetratricopeptide (TPR) repeat protein